MRKIASFLAVSLVAFAGSAYALTAPSVLYDESMADGTGDIRSNDCPATTVFSTGMFDDFLPAPCASAFNAQCFVEAPIPDPSVLDPYWRTGADDFYTNGETITHVKVWGRFSAEGWLYGDVRGFCIKIYEEPATGVYCPDGSLPNVSDIGTEVYNQHVSAGGFVAFDIPVGLSRCTNYCITLPVAFPTVAGKIYWLAVAADYDLVNPNLDPASPTDVTQWFWRAINPAVAQGGNPSFCEAAYSYCFTAANPAGCDPWLNIEQISLAGGLPAPCWAGWDGAFVVSGEVATPTGACCDAAGLCSITTAADCFGQYQGDGTVCDPSPCIVIPTEESSWGSVKARFSK